MQTTRGAVWALRVGWLGALVGAFLLLATVVQHVAATHGSGLGYDPDPPSVGYHGWGMVASVFGPMVGFNLIYFGAPAVQRQRHLALFMGLVALQVVAVVAATLWVVGAGLPAGVVTAEAGSGAAAVVTPLSFLVVTSIAAAIMYWLGGSSDFDRRSGEYFGQGSTTVAVAPASLRARLLGIGALVVAAVAVALPLVASGYRHGVGGGAQSRPWPLPYADAQSLRDLTTGLLLLVSVPLGVAVSMLLKAWLYAAAWRERAERSRERPPSFGKWLATTTQHVPMVGAVACWTLGLGLGLPRAASGHAGSAFWALPVGAGFALLEVLVLSQMWRVQDQRGRARPMRLSMAAPPPGGLGPR